MKVNQITNYEFFVNEVIPRCKKCLLSSITLGPVPPRGNMGAKIMLVGEAPGSDEETYKKPFIGASGKLLSSMLKEAGINEDSLYITNAVKCRPPKNRQPMYNEIESCRDMLLHEIITVKPTVIVPMGNIAWKLLMTGWMTQEFYIDGSDTIPHLSISQVAGKFIDVDLIGIYPSPVEGHKKPRPYKIFPVYHPAYCLRNRDLIEVEIDFFKMLKDIA
jgi:uracil-DNA glycosylase family 4